MTDYAYILDKVLHAEIINEPFEYIEITNFLSEEHLNEILNDNQIHFEETINENELYKKLLYNDYEIVKFPGCVNNWNDYINKVNDCNEKSLTKSFGLTFRLKKYKNENIKRLIEFMNSFEFQNVLKKKFGSRRVAFPQYISQCLLSNLY